jgi:hypothetical protein
VLFSLFLLIVTAMMKNSLDGIDIALITSVISLAIGYYFWSIREKEQEKVVTKQVTLAELKYVYWFDLDHQWGLVLGH